MQQKVVNSHSYSESKNRPVIPGFYFPYLYGQLMVYDERLPIRGLPFLERAFGSKAYGVSQPRPLALLVELG
jgi:hypothetical protein